MNMLKHILTDCEEMFHLMIFNIYSQARLVLPGAIMMHVDYLLQYECDWIFRGHNCCTRP
jgi:hypothetical protein